MMTHILCLVAFDWFDEGEATGAGDDMGERREAGMCGTSALQVGGWKACCGGGDNATPDRPSQIKSFNGIRNKMWPSQDILWE